MTLRTKLEDLGIDTDNKEMYELTKFIYLEAQKKLAKELKLEWCIDGIKDNTCKCPDCGSSLIGFEKTLK